MALTPPPPSARAPVEPVDVLITGASGFVGRALAARLEGLGLTVQATDVVAGARPTVRLDVTDGAEALDVLDRLKPRIVVHAAAIVDERARQDVAHQVNVHGTGNVVDAAATVGVERFVHVSSIAALGVDPGVGVDEDAPLVFDTGAPYFDTKAAAEALVREAGARGALPVVIVRPGDVYGAGSVPWVERPLALIRRRLPVLIGGGQGLIAHTWIDNLVDALVLACTHEAAPGGVFHVTDGVDTTTFKAYLERLAAAAGASVPAGSVPLVVALGMGAVFEASQRVTGRPMPYTRAAARYICRRSTYRIDRAREQLGYRPAVDLDEGFARLATSLTR